MSASLVAWLISARTRSTLASIVSTRDSVSTYCAVTSSVEALREWTVPSLASSSRVASRDVGRHGDRDGAVAAGLGEVGLARDRLGEDHALGGGRDRPDAAGRGVDVLDGEGDVRAAGQLAVEHGGRDGRTAWPWGGWRRDARGRVLRHGSGLVAADGHLLGLRAAAPGAPSRRRRRCRYSPRGPRAVSASAAAAVLSRRAGRSRCAHDDSFVGPVVGVVLALGRPAWRQSSRVAGLDPVTTGRQVGLVGHATDSAGRPSRPGPPRVASGAVTPA